MVSYLIMVIVKIPSHLEVIGYLLNAHCFYAHGKLVELFSSMECYGYTDSDETL